MEMWIFINKKPGLAFFEVSENLRDFLAKFLNDIIKKKKSHDATEYATGYPISKHYYNINVMPMICHCLPISIFHESFAGPDKRLSNEIIILKPLQEIKSAMHFRNEYTTTMTHKFNNNRKIYTTLW